MTPDHEPPAHDPPWTGERPRQVNLVHPLPLGAAALLFANDHLLKGAGLLPGVVTGKLSDFAGLFVFPVLVVGSVEWGLGRFGRGLSPRRTAMLVWGVVAVTGVVFTALKLVPAVNRLLGAVMGPNSMDATDLVALTALAASGVWMSRRGGRSVATRGEAGTLPTHARCAPLVSMGPRAAPNPRAPRCSLRARDAGSAPGNKDVPGDSPASRWLHGLAMMLVALACAATSAPPRPPPKLEPQPVSVAPRNKACAVVTPITCRYDAARYAVRLSGRKVIEGGCKVRVGGVYSVPQEGVNRPVVDAPVVDLGDKEASLFGAWGHITPRPAATATAGATTALDPARMRVYVQQHGSDPDGPMNDDSTVDVACRPGFTDDTLPPAQVAR